METTGKMRIVDLYGELDYERRGYIVIKCHDQIGNHVVEFSIDDGHIACDANGMSSEFVREVLLALLDAADMEES